MNPKTLLNHKRPPPPSIPKAFTGIDGFDDITNGGLPRGRTTLFEGGPGSGKTIMALQTLVNGARLHNEPGIFVAFEESSERITINAAKFGWDLEDLQKRKLFFLDAQPSLELVQSGGFDLSGMLAALSVKAREIKAKRVVFDAVDVVLALMRDPAAEQREVYRLHEWLLASGLTGVMTAKGGSYQAKVMNYQHLGFMQFMVDCSVVLNHDVVEGVSQRNLRVVKYRGANFAENESPFLIGDTGMEVAGAREWSTVKTPPTRERISSGVPRLDAMLGGGYYRNSSVLITGVPGTAKSTLCGAFAESACMRGEKTLYVSFDSDADEVIRNLTSVNVRLERFVKKGVLRVIWERSITGSAESHLMRIKSAAKEHGATCVVIDPVSALSKLGNRATATSVAERLLDWTKTAGITLVCTSLIDASVQMEGTPLQISTLADTWIHLNYLVHAGERNRGLSIIKSRGTAHSNQVRELLLSDRGVTLADAYTAGGEVLMGTLRWEKELAVRTALEEGLLAAKQKQVQLELEEAELVARLKGIQIELDAKRAQKKALNHLRTNRTEELNRERNQLREMRGVDRK